MKKLFYFVIFIVIAISSNAQSPSRVYALSSATNSNISIDPTQKPFSAIGNGIADDTIPLQAALNAAVSLIASNQSSAVVYLPANKVFKITSTLNIPPTGRASAILSEPQSGPWNGLKILGYRGSSMIDATAITNGIAMQAWCDASTNNYPTWYGLTLEGFTLVGPGVTLFNSGTNSIPIPRYTITNTYTSTGLRLGSENFPQPIHNGLIEKVDVLGFQTNVLIKYTTTTQIRNCNFKIGTMSDLCLINSDGGLLDTVVTGYIPFNDIAWTPPTNYLGSIYVNGGLGNTFINIEPYAAPILLHCTNAAKVTVIAGQFEPSSTNLCKTPIIIGKNTTQMSFIECQFNSWNADTNLAFITGYDGGLDYLTQINTTSGLTCRSMREIDNTIDYYNRMPTLIGGYQSDMYTNNYDWWQIGTSTNYLNVSQINNFFDYNKTIKSDVNASLTLSERIRTNWYSWGDLSMSGATRLAPLAAADSPWLWPEGVSVAGNTDGFLEISIPPWANKISVSYMVETAAASTWTNLWQGLIYYTSPSGGRNLWFTTEQVVGATNNAKMYTIDMDFGTSTDPKIIQWKVGAATNTATTRYISGPGALKVVLNP